MAPLYAPNIINFEEIIMLKISVAIVSITYAISAHADLPFNPLIEVGQTSYSFSPSSGKIQYKENSYKRIGDKVYEVAPGTTNIQYHKPAYKIEGNRVYEVSRGTNRVLYGKPSFIIK